MHNDISRMSRALEDQFFFNRNRILAEQHARLKKDRECADSLTKVSGITNPDVLKELIAFEIRPETLAALSLVPIIEVAWADGSIDEKEESAILDVLSKEGMADDRAILKEWLEKKPDAKFLAAWKAYIRGLSEVLHDDAMKTLKNSILQHSRNVAESSGQFRGLFNPISPAERKVLDSIASFFKDIDKK